MLVFEVIEAVLAQSQRHLRLLQLALVLLQIIPEIVGPLVELRDVAVLAVRELQVLGLVLVVFAQYLLVVPLSLVVSLAGRVQPALQRLDVLVVFVDVGLQAAYAVLHVLLGLFQRRFCALPLVGLVAQLGL